MESPYYGESVLWRVRTMKSLYRTSVRTKVLREIIYKFRYKMQFFIYLKLLFFKKVCSLNFFFFKEKSSENKNKILEKSHIIDETIKKM